METNQINLRRVEDINAPETTLVRKTYEDSFPANERRDYELVLNLIANEPRFSLTILLRDEQYAGFITGWDFGDFIYLEHFAIDESMRNGGIGSKAFKAYLGQLDKPVVLEVEMPNDEMSKRRIGFYERLGLKLDTHTYFQPPYRKGDDFLEMRLMTYGPIDLKKDFNRVKEIIHKHVYNA